MTVSSVVNKAQFLGSGSTGPFSFPFRFFSNEDVTVIKSSSSGPETLSEGVHYALAGAGLHTGGSVTLNTALADGERLTVLRTPAPVQETSFRNQGGFFPETHEDALDYQTMVIQSLDEKAGHSLRFHPSEDVSGAMTYVPFVEDRAGKVLGFDAFGDLAFYAPGESAQSSGSLAVASAPDIATLRTITGNALRRDVVVLGYYTPGDGGGGPVRAWKTGSAGTYTDNGGSVIVPTGGDGSGAWVMTQTNMLFVEWFGAVGDGVTNDTAAIQAAGSAIKAAGGGSLFFSPGKTYRVFPSGGSTGEKLIDLAGCSGIMVEGNGSKILTGAVTLPLRCFDLNGTTDVVIRNLQMESEHAALSSSTGIFWIVASYGAKRLSLENLTFKYGCVGFVAMGAISAQGNDNDRVQGIRAFNLSFESCYYPLSFQGAGDDFFARAIYTRNCGRSYFPYNCKNHDLHLDSRHGGPFSDVLLKVYGSSGFYSRLENIRLVYTSDGRYPNAGNQNLDEAMVAMDFQLHTVNPSGGFIQNIDITFNVEAAFADKSQSLFVVRKYDAAGAADTTGSRGHQLVGLDLRGVGRSLQNLTGDSVRFFTRSPDNWTGESAKNINVHDLTLANISSQKSLSINGAPLDGSFSMQRVAAYGTFNQTNTAGKDVGIDESFFSGYTAPSRLPQAYSPAWTSDGTQPSIGNGSVLGSYTVQGKLCTVQLVFLAGSTTTFGTGNWRFSLPMPAASGLQDSVGAAFGLDSGVGFVIGASIVAAGASTVQAILGAAPSNYVNAAVPFSWAANDYIKIEITYPIA